MLDAVPPPLSPDDALELRRRQRTRNIAMLVVLVTLAALFYAIAVVRFKVH